MDVKLFQAARKGNVRFLRKTREENKLEKYLCSRTHQGNNIVHIAAKFGHELFAKIALKKCPSLLHEKNLREDTPLHVAARAGKIAVVNVLIKYAKEMTTLEPLWRMENWEHNTALHEALGNGRKEVGVVLLDLDPELASSVNQAGESPLYLAAEARLYRVLRKIVSQKSFSVEGPFGRNPLHAAVFARSAVITRFLATKKGELIKRRDNYGKTALHYAAEANSIKITRILLKMDDTSAYVHDNVGNYPLHVAASSGSRKTVRAILKCCPDTIEQLNNTDQNALHLAVRNNSHKTVRKLLKMQEIRGLINEQDNEGNTPLHIATTFNHYQMVRELIPTRGVNLSAKNKEGLTALDICELKWELSHRQKFLWRYLTRQKPSRGRHLSQARASRILGSTFTHPKADLKLVANTLSVVATLMATVTFAAAFTMPGGYNNSGGACLATKAALQIFVLSDTLAMCCSMMVVFLLTSAMVGDPAYLVGAVSRSSRLLFIALYASMVAFETGLYVVLDPEAFWVAICVCIMASIVPFVIHWLRHKSAIETPQSMILQRSKSKITKEQDPTVEENVIQVAVETPPKYDITKEQDPTQNEIKVA